LRDLPLVGREHREHLHREVERQLVEKRGAVVRRQRVEQRRGLLLVEHVQQFFLRVDRQVGERRRRQLARAHAKQPRQFLDRHVRDDWREVGREPRLQIFFERGVILAVDQRSSSTLTLACCGMAERDTPRRPRQSRSVKFSRRFPFRRRAHRPRPPPAYLTCEET